MIKNQRKINFFFTNYRETRHDFIRHDSAIFAKGGCGKERSVDLAATFTWKHESGIRPRANGIRAYTATTGYDLARMGTDISGRNVVAAMLNAFDRDT